MKFSDFMVSSIDYRKGYEDLLSSIETEKDLDWIECIFESASGYLYFEALKSLYKSKAKNKPLHFKAVKDVFRDCILEDIRLYVSSDCSDYGNGKRYYTNIHSFRRGKDRYFYLPYENETNMINWEKAMDIDIDILEPSSIRSIYERQKAENEAYIKEVEAIKAAYENKRAKDTYIGTKLIYYRKH